LKKAEQKLIVFIKIRRDTMDAGKYVKKCILLFLAIIILLICACSKNPKISPNKDLAPTFKLAWGYGGGGYEESGAVAGNEGLKQVIYIYIYLIKKT
jgi:hypothetical protein